MKETKNPLLSKRFWGMIITTLGEIGTIVLPEYAVAFNVASKIGSFVMLWGMTVAKKPLM